MIPLLYSPMIALVVILTFLALIRGATLEFKRTPLVSRKLCNNDPNDKLPQKCYNSQYTTEVECDSRKVTSGQCNQVNVTLNSLTIEALNELGRFIDSDSTIRRVGIDVTAMKSPNVPLLGDMVDLFMLPRPMWYVVAEPYNDTDPVQYVFERFTQLWDPYFEFITRQQFPSPEVCARSQLMVGHADCLQPGYSDVRKFYFGEMAHSPIPYAVFVPVFGTAKAFGRAFISDEDCPLERKNRWTCAFLQMTNCSVPEPTDNLLERAIGLYNATALGGNFTHISNVGVVEHAAKFHRNHEYQAYRKRSEVLMRSIPPFVYTSPFTHAANMFKFHGPDEHQVAEFLFMELLYRKNSFYRRKVADSFAAFRAKYNLGSAVRTKDRRFVGVHIRRSDRTLKGVNMTDFCYHLLVQRFTHVKQNCTYEGGVVMECAGNENLFGCDQFDDVPVGAVTLDSVVQEAELLIGPSIRNMIVFSEELDWLEHQILINAKLHPEWRFFTMDSPGHETKFASRSIGTAAGVFFHATIDMVQECDALLGHFTSGVPMTFAGAMCHHHAGMEGICPPVYNLKQKLQ